MKAKPKMPPMAMMKAQAPKGKKPAIPMSDPASMPPQAFKKGGRACGMKAKAKKK